MDAVVSKEGLADSILEPITIDFLIKKKTKKNTEQYFLPTPSAKFIEGPFYKKKKKKIV